VSPSRPTRAQAPRDQDPFSKPPITDQKRKVIKRMHPRMSIKPLGILVFMLSTLGAASAQKNEIGLLLGGLKTGNKDFQLPAPRPASDRRRAYFSGELRPQISRFRSRLTVRRSAVSGDSKHRRQVGKRSCSEELRLAIHNAGTEAENLAAFENNALRSGRGRVCATYRQQVPHKQPTQHRWNPGS
jgi:hypothetical protein